MLSERKYDLNSVVHGCITIAIIAALYLLIRRLSGVLLPFIASWVIAYQLHPIVSFFQYKCRFRSRGLSVGITMLLLLGFIAGIIVLVVPMITTEMTKLAAYATDYLTRFSSNHILPPALQGYYQEWVSTLTIQDVLSNPDIASVVQRMAPKLWGLLSGSISAITGMTVIFICFLYIVFILLDFEVMEKGWPELIPHKYRARVTRVIEDVQNGMHQYFRGQALVASIVGVLFAICFQIIGLPMAIVMGIFIGVLNMVPYLQTIAVIPCILLGILQSAETGRPFWLILLLLFVSFVIVQGLQDLVLTPKIMGKKMGLHPAIILLSLSIWGSLLGILGMIIALPITVVIISYYKHYIANSEITNAQSEEGAKTGQK